MIPAFLIEDLSAAWTEGGSRAYIYIGHLWDWAIRCRDYELAALADWLEDVLNARTETELTTESLRANP